MRFLLAPEIKSEINQIVKSLGLAYINSKQVICFRSYGSSSRAIARIWSLPRIWQLGLKVDPHYCLEVIAERFDRLNREAREKVLIHELLHIPKNFSGSLLPHRQRGKRIDRRQVDHWHRLLQAARSLS